MAHKKKIKDVKVYSASGMATFKGFIKSGLDSSTLINLIIVFDGKSESFKQRGFTSPPNLFYCHEISRSEVIGVLINEYGFTKNEAIEVLNKLVNEFSLSKIVRVPELDASFELVVEEANKKVVDKHNNKLLKIGIPDVIIIAGFLRNNLNFVHSGDQGFLKTCEELGISSIPTHKRDIGKENEIKKLMQKKK